MGLEALERGFKDAVARWRAVHSTDETPRFWELDFEIPEPEFKRAVEQAARLLRLKLRAHPVAESILLFQVLSSRVSNATLSSFWPQVATELGRMTGDDICPNALANRWRDCLRRAYRRQLEQIEHVRCYVTLCFEESGTGLDRTVIVRSFFENLVSGYPGKLEGEQREEFLEESVRFIENGHDESNVQPLTNLMKSSGRELLDLLDCLRSTVDIADAGAWNWPRLRAYWRKRSGRDLARLMPEAREIFEALLPSIAASMTRTEARRLAGRHGLEFVVPGGRAEQDGHGAGELPVGQMKLRHGKGSARDIRILDDSGLSADRVDGFEASCWHTVNGHHLIRRSGPFEVRATPWRVDKSVPYFLGPHDPQGQPAGWLWSARIDSARIPVDLESGTAPVLEPELSIRHTWTIRNGRLALDLKGFSVLNGEFDGDALLRSGETVVWAGEILDVPVREPLSSRLVVEGIESVEFVFIDAAERTAAIRISHPLGGGAAIFVNGQARLDRDIRTDRLDHVDILVHPDLGRPEVAGAKLLERDTVHVSGVRCDRYGLARDDGGVRTISVAAGRGRWSISPGRSADLIPISPTSLVYQDVRFTPIGAVQPVDVRHPLEIGILLPDGDSTVFSEDDLLVIDSMGRKLAFPLGSMDNERRSSRGFSLDLFELVREEGAEIPFGYSTVRLEGPHVDRYTTLSLFVLRGELTRLPSRFDETPELEFACDEHVLFQLKAMTPPDPRDRHSDPVVHSSIELGRNDALSVSWTAPIEDVALLAGESFVHEPEVGVNSVGGPLILKRFGQSRSVLVAQLGDDVEVEVEFTGNEVNLTAQLQTLLADREFAVHTVEVAVLEGVDRSPAHSWMLDLAPVVDDIELAWEYYDGSPSLRIDHRISALAGQVVSFVLVAREVGIDLEVDRVLQGKGLATTRIPCFPDGDCATLRLKVEYHGADVFESKAPPFEFPDDPALLPSSATSVKRTIKAITGGTWKSTNSNCFQLLRLYEKWCRLSPGRRWPADALLRRVTRAECGETDRQLSTGLRLLESFHQDRDVIFDYTIPQDSDGLSVYLASLAFIDQLRNRKTGTMRPARVREAEQIFVIAFRKGIHADWCRCMLALCRELLGEVAPGASEGRLQDGACLQSPLVEIDRGLLDMLDELAKECVE